MNFYPYPELLDSMPSILDPVVIAVAVVATVVVCVSITIVVIIVFIKRLVTWVVFHERFGTVLKI